nr:MAG TPA: hypothetical protein [Caudoviricetes sp.]
MQLSAKSKKRLSSLLHAVQTMKSQEILLLISVLFYLIYKDNILSRR